MTDEPPKVGFCEAAKGDYCAVQFDKPGRGARWHLGEVLAVTKLHSRVKLMADRKGELVKVGPKDRIRIAKLRKISLVRASEQLATAPEEGFATWEEARAHLLPALLREEEKHEPHD